MGLVGVKNISILDSDVYELPCLPLLQFREVMGSHKSLPGVLRSHTSAGSSAQMAAAADNRRCPPLPVTNPFGALGQKASSGDSVGKGSGRQGPPVATTGETRVKAHTGSKRSGRRSGRSKPDAEVAFFAAAGLIQTGAKSGATSASAEVAPPAPPAAAGRGKKEGTDGVLPPPIDGIEAVERELGAREGSLRRAILEDTQRHQVSTC